MRLLYLSSKDAITGKPSDFEVKLINTLSVAEGGRFRIDQLRLGIAFMLINENNRNLYFREGYEVRHAVLEIGQYTSETLATTLAYVMNAAPGLLGRFSCTYSPVSSCTVLTYTPPSAHPYWTMQFLSDSEVPPAFPTINDPKSFLLVLGGYTTGMNGSNTVLTFRFISTQPYDVLYLCSRRLGSTAIQGPRGSCNTLMQIVINQPFGSVQEASMPVDVWIPCDGLTCHRLDFQLQDSAGNIVDTLGGDISFLLSIDDGNS